MKYLKSIIMMVLIVVSVIAAGCTSSSGTYMTYAKSGVPVHYEVVVQQGNSTVYGFATFHYDTKNKTVVGSGYIIEDGKKYSASIERAGVDNIKALKDFCQINLVSDGKSVMIGVGRNVKDGCKGFTEMYLMLGPFLQYYDFYYRGYENKLIYSNGKVKVYEASFMNGEEKIVAYGAYYDHKLIGAGMIMDSQVMTVREVEVFNVDGSDEVMSALKNIVGVNG